MDKLQALLEGTAREAQRLCREMRESYPENIANDAILWHDPGFEQARQFLSKVFTVFDGDWDMDAFQGNILFFSPKAGSHRRRSDVEIPQGNGPSQPDEDIEMEEDEATRKARQQEQRQMEKLRKIKVSIYNQLCGRHPDQRGSGLPGGAQRDCRVHARARQDLQRVL
jgi:hypothetical protein